MTILDKFTVPTPATLARGFGVAALVGTLAACVDVDMKIDVLGDDLARGTMTMSMSREFYDMSQAQGGEEFCSEDDELIVQDTVVTCVSTQEGSFDEVIDASEDEPAPTLEAMGDGTVKVTFPTAAIAADVGSEAPDAETLAMMSSMFEGKNFSLTVAGSEFVETNMDKSEDGKSASLVIPMIDLISGSIEVSEDSYAIVKY